MSEKELLPSLAEHKVENLETAIFIGGIPLTSSRKQILDFLQKFDPVKSLHLPRDRASGKLKGYAKAVLTSQTGVDTLLNCTEPHRIDHLTVGVSRWKNQRDYIMLKDQHVNSKVYVKFPSSVSREDLFTYFNGKFGLVRDIDIKTDPFTKRLRDFCYISFEEEQSARLAVSQGPHTISGYQIRCEMSTPAHLVRGHQTEGHRQKPKDLKLQNLTAQAPYTNSAPVNDIRDDHKLDNSQQKIFSDKNKSLAPVTMSPPSNKIGGNISNPSQFKPDFSSKDLGLPNQNLESTCREYMYKSMNKIHYSKDSNVPLQVRKPTSSTYHKDCSKLVFANHLKADNVQLRIHLRLRGG